MTSGTHILTSIPPTSHPNRAKTKWGPHLMSRLWLAFRGVVAAGRAAYEFRNIEWQKALATRPGANLEPRLEVVPRWC
ncbi:MAG TPA: hypothetical protein VFV66_24695 [Nonomuraea sp.]|nr:hypothetical protein [Nonomuraea sp.]